MRPRGEIEAWIVDYLAEYLRIPRSKIEVTKPVQDYGLDSTDAAELTGRLEEWLGSDVDPMLVHECPTIHAIASKLGEAEALLTS